MVLNLYLFERSIIEKKRFKKEQGGVGQGNKKDRGWGGWRERLPVFCAYLQTHKCTSP